MDEPLSDGAWDIVSASPLPYLEHSVVPREMTSADMDQITADFVAAARNAASARFDMIEVHLAHGYLLSSFISPVTNLREDQFGGDIESRMRFPLRVIREMRAAWPADRCPFASPVSG